MKPCKYDPEYICLRANCIHTTFNSCLKVSVLALTRELSVIKTRQMQKHSLTSPMYRRSALYYKWRANQLEKALISNNIPVPKVEGVPNEQISGDDKNKSNGQK